MAFQFPASPAVNQTFTPVAGTTYRWSGTAWHLIAGPGTFITQAEGDARYLQQAGADALYVNVNEVPNIQNRIINGKFAIDQRNAGAAINSVGSVVAMDRWFPSAAAAGVFSTMREADALYPGEFRAKMTVTTAAASLAAGDQYGLSQKIEGINLADLAMGTVNAAQVTIALEVECSITGTFSVSLRNDAANRSYVATFTVNAPNVREQKVLTLQWDTAGVWNVGNGIGTYFNICFAAGTNFNAPANTWTAGNLISVAGATNFMATVGNTMRLRNVRLYKGSVDFGPDRRLYAEELALCQRYYWEWQALGAANPVATGACIGTTSAAFVMPLPVLMRAAPTVSASAPGDFQCSNAAGGNVVGTSVSGTLTTVNTALIDVGVASGLVAGNATRILSFNANARLKFSAEL